MNDLAAMKQATLEAYMVPAPAIARDPSYIASTIASLERQGFIQGDQWGIMDSTSQTVVRNRFRAPHVQGLLPATKESPSDQNPD